MLRGMIAALAILGLILTLGVAAAQESEGILKKITDPMKKLVPGGEEQAGAQKEGEGMLEEMKKVMPGEKEQAGAQKEGEGIMQKMTDPFKKIIPGGEEK